MITIVAEKRDVGKKIAAALDKITLKNGKTVDFSMLAKFEKEIKKQQDEDGFLEISWDKTKCIVTWARGHLCELKQAQDYNPDYKSWSKLPMPFIPSKYELKVSDYPLDKKQFSVIKKYINDSDYVINALDTDREGEVIFSYIYEMAECKKPVKRAWFDSQTKGGIIDGFTKSLRDGASMKPIETAGRMRNIADWVVGANITTITTLKNPGQGVLSIGRVQTPTLSILVKRELEIRNFKSVPYWTIEGEFEKAGDTFKGKHEKEKIFDKTEAENIFRKVNGKSGIVTEIEKKITTKSVPELYSLSALQMDANSKYKFTLKKTLDIAQSLYDKGLTTYPRTKSRYLTEDMEPVINDVLDKIKGIGKYTSLIDGKTRTFDFPRFFNDKKVDGHFAIIPTGVIPTSLNDEEEKIYDLICRSIIKMLYKEAVLEKTKVKIDVSGETFLSEGQIIKDPGWMVVGDTSKETILPHLEKNDVLSGTYELPEKKTEPPKRYTDKTLLSAMLTAGKDLPDKELKKIMSDPKTGGIGTEATRAQIIETLLNRGYIERKDKSFIATEKGISLIENLPIDDLKSAELTGIWEKRLLGIENGTENPVLFKEDIEKAVKVWVNEINSKMITIPSSSSLGLLCPKCGGELKEYKWGFGCAEYKTGCNFSIGKICGKQLTKSQVTELLTHNKTKEIKGFTSKAGKKFNATLILKEDKTIGFQF